MSRRFLKRVADATSSLTSILTTRGDIPYKGSDGITRLPIGTSGQVLRGGTDPQWGTPGAGAWTFIQKKTPTATGKVDFVLPIATYNLFRLVAYNVRPATNGVEGYIRLSTDGGVTFATGVSDYYWELQSVGAGITDAADSEIQLTETATTNTIGNAVNAGIAYMEAIISNAAVTGNSTSVSYTFYFHKQNDNAIRAVQGAGQTLLNRDDDAVRFLFSTGNITSGTFILYGSVES